MSIDAFAHETVASESTSENPAAETGKAVAVIDLDTVMPGSLLYDFGDAIRFGANTAAEDEPDTSKVSLSTEKYSEFLNGFLEGIGDSITDTEKKLLPSGAALLTYEQAMRFLGDYLNGDTYFKVNYDKHNLVRAKPRSPSSPTLRRSCRSSKSSADPRFCELFVNV